MAAMDPELERAVSQRPLPNMSFGTDSRAKRAEHLTSLRHMLPMPTKTDEIEETQHTVRARDGYEIPIVVYRKANSETKDRTDRPLILLFHEGGWCMGDLDDEAPNARLFASNLDCVCINTDYRLAPEHVFPTGTLDCWDVVQWAVSNAAELGANPEKGLVVGGSSAGANISAALAHMSVQHNLSPPITGQWLSVPYVFSPEHLPQNYREQYSSLWDNTSDPVLPTLEEPERFVTVSPVVTELLKVDIHSPLFSVLAEDSYSKLQETSKSPRLAKAFFQVAGLDPLRDQGLIYEKIMREDWGVETKLNLYPGYGHMFWTNWPEMQRSKAFWADMVAGMRWLLYPTSDGSR